MVMEIEYSQVENLTMDIHGCLLGSGSIFKFLYKFKWFRDLSDLLSWFIVPTFIFTVFLRVNKKALALMKYYKSRGKRVIILTSTGYRCKRVIEWILKIKGVTVYDKIELRMDFYQSHLEYKFTMIKKYNSLHIDDNADVIRACNEIFFKKNSILEISSPIAVHIDNV